MRHRLLMRVGWAGIALAVYFATAAALLDSVRAWWAVVAVAVIVLIVAALIPEPVPHDLIVDGRRRVDDSPN